MASTQVPRIRRGTVKKGTPASPRSILDFTLVPFSRLWSSLAEGVMQAVKLEDVTSKAFGLVNQWLYFHEFPSSPSNAPSLENLVKVWMAAEQFRMPAVPNYVSGVLCERLVEPEVLLETVTFAEHRRLADGRFDDYLACIKHIYFSTPAGEHNLKQLVLDIFPYHQLSFADRVEEFPIAFCQDAVRRLAEKTRGSGNWPLNRTSRFLVGET
ncbi:hypothetical protein IFR05_011515 [Cadophora sp. M221]|nr:hypothetical protein IFR05_011515 [Cadophora sp. M221]